MTLAWYDPTNHHVSTNKDDPLFTPLGQLWPLVVKREWVSVTEEEFKQEKPTTMGMEYAANFERAESETREKVRKPLTDAEIYECYRAEFGIMWTDSGAQNTIKKFARAIERAHGIGVKDE